MKALFILSGLIFLLIGGPAFAQQRTEAIPLLKDESAMPRLYSAKIVDEGNAKGRADKALRYRNYRSKLLYDPNSGALADVSWTFFQRSDGVVPTVSTTMTGDPALDSFGYVNGFLLGFVANVCFGIEDKNMTALGNWYVETLERAASTGQGVFSRSFGPVHVSLELTRQGKRTSRIEQELHRSVTLDGSWRSYCTLEAGDDE